MKRWRCNIVGRNITGLRLQHYGAAVRGGGESISRGVATDRQLQPQSIVFPFLGVFNFSLIAVRPWQAQLGLNFPAIVIALLSSNRSFSALRVHISVFIILCVAKPISRDGRTLSDSVSLEDAKMECLACRPKATSSIQRSSSISSTSSSRRT